MIQNTNLRLLSEVADIRTGYTFREKVEEVEAETGSARIAQRGAFGSLGFERRRGAPLDARGLYQLEK